MQSVLHIPLDIPDNVLYDLENLHKDKGNNVQESVITASSSFDDVLTYLTEDVKVLDAKNDLNASSSPQESERLELSVPTQQIEDNKPAMSEETTATTSEANGLSIQPEENVATDLSETIGQSHQVVSNQSLSGSWKDSTQVERSDQGVGSHLPGLQPTDVRPPKYESIESPGKENRRDQAGPSTSNNGRKPFVCKVCNKSFAKNSHLKQHSIIHSDVRPHKCDLCGKTFVSSRYLKTHLSVHTNVKPHKCEVCQVTFRRQCALIIHSKTHIS